MSSIWTIAVRGCSEGGAWSVGPANVTPYKPKHLNAHPADDWQSFMPIGICIGISSPSQQWCAEVTVVADVGVAMPVAAGSKAIDAATRMPTMVRVKRIRYATNANYPGIGSLGQGRQFASRGPHKEKCICRRTRWPGCEQILAASAISMANIPLPQRMMLRTASTVATSITIPRMSGAGIGVRFSTAS